MSFTSLSFTFCSLLIMWDCLYMYSLHEFHFPFRCEFPFPITPSASRGFSKHKDIISILNVNHFLPAWFSGQTYPYEKIFLVALSVAGLRAQKKQTNKRPRGLKPAFQKRLRRLPRAKASFTNSAVHNRKCCVFLTKQTN